MMSIIDSIILGIVQGFTEFLPVSSSGHLVLFEKLFNINSNVILFNVLLHFASLIAVIIMFRKTILYLIKNPFSTQAKKLYFATIPTVIIVLMFKKFIENSFTSSFFVYGFLFTALFLIIAEIIAKKYKSSSGDIKYSSAFIMGIAQGFATLPGVSRSGSTICTGLILGEDREQTASFSFLMSIPIILASMIYELIFGGSIEMINILPIIIGMIFTFIFSILSIKIMMNLIKKANLFYFSAYLIILSILIFAFKIY
jgi:undecaprenyl-diphosphatase